MRYRLTLASALTVATLLFAAAPVEAPLAAQARAAAGTALPTPEAFLGHAVGADGKLARWDKMLEYLGLVDAASDRIEMRELGKITQGNPFVAWRSVRPTT